MISTSSALASSQPATSSKEHQGDVLALEAGAGLAEGEQPLGAALTLAHREVQHSTDQQDGQHVHEQGQKPIAVALADLDLDLSLNRPVGQGGIVQRQHPHGEFLGFHLGQKRHTAFGRDFLCRIQFALPAHFHAFRALQHGEAFHHFGGVLHEPEELVVGEFTRGRIRRRNHLGNQKHQEDKDDKEPAAPGEAERRFVRVPFGVSVVVALVSHLRSK
jgi:hypothetical protein